MVITQVELQKTLQFRLEPGPKRYNIYLDGKFALGADEDLVVEKRLVVGKEISNEDLKKLLFEAEVGILMGRMYRLFSIRMRSEKEVKDYLKSSNFKRRVKGKEELSDLVIDATINKLKQKELINDEVFAKAWVESRRSSKKKGKIAIKAELYQKGIDREIVDKLLSNAAIEPESEEQLAEEALRKWLKKLTALPYLEKKKKALEYLMRNGFEYSVAKEVVVKLIKK